MSQKIYQKWGYQPLENTPERVALIETIKGRLPLGAMSSTGTYIVLSAEDVISLSWLTEKTRPVFSLECMEDDLLGELASLPNDISSLDLGYARELEWLGRQVGVWADAINGDRFQQ